MNIAPTLIRQLAQQGIAYDVKHHNYTNTSLNSAYSASVPTSQVVKSVLLEDDDGYVMALVPANLHVKINQLNIALNRNMKLASEHELRSLFIDCELGAIPPIGEAYGIETIVDYNFDDCSDVYIEAGNHTDLLHLSGSSFRKLMQSAQHANLCVH